MGLGRRHLPALTPTWPGPTTVAKPLRRPILPHLAQQSRGGTLTPFVLPFQSGPQCHQPASSASAKKVRRNRTTFDFIKNNNLFTRDGLRAFTKTISFPSDSIEVKANWVPVQPVVAIPPPNGAPADPVALSRQHDDRERTAGPIRAGRDARDRPRWCRTGPGPPSSTATIPDAATCSGATIRSARTLPSVAADRASLYTGGLYPKLHQDAGPAGGVRSQQDRSGLRELLPEREPKPTSPTRPA